jgi:hypothetical protein
MTENDPQNPVPPIVVGSDDGVLLFASLDTMARSLESPDVLDGVYGPAFDATGRPVAITAPDPPSEKRWFRHSGPVSATFDPGAPARPEALVALLQERLGSEDTDLATLLDAALRSRGITE